MRSFWLAYAAQDFEVYLSEDGTQAIALLDGATAWETQVRERIGKVVGSMGFTTMTESGEWPEGQYDEYDKYVAA